MRNLKVLNLKVQAWDVTFQPHVASITSMKLQSAAHSEEPTFNVTTVKTGDATDLVFSFGDAKHTRWRVCIPV